jgi:hypothetical protein
MRFIDIQTFKLLVLLKKLIKKNNCQFSEVNEKTTF